MIFFKFSINDPSSLNLFLIVTLKVFVLDKENKTLTHIDTSHKSKSNNLKQLSLTARSLGYMHYWIVECMLF